MVNKIWAFFIIVGLLFGILTDNLTELNKQILDCSKMALDMIIEIFPIMALWLGIMNIAKKAGLLDKLSKAISTILHPIFKEIPKNHEVFSYMGSNIIANVFGLGNAATPFGLKTMQSLQELNDDKRVASRSMITFLVINTSGLTIVPTTVISLRMMHGSSNPTEIILACILATFVSTIGGLIFDNFLARRKRND